MPILNIIKKQQLNNVLIAVIRYFGGVKLGAGGLIRAYAKLASDSLKNAQIIEFVSYSEYQVILTYEEVSTLEKTNSQKLFEITKKEYGDKVKVNLLIFEENEHLLQEFLNNIFNKNIQLNFINTILKEKK